MNVPEAAAPGFFELRRGTELMGRYHRFDAEPPLAEHFEPAADPDLVADAVLADLAGWTLTTSDEALADALIGKGALLTRHYALMSCDLTDIDLSGGEATVLTSLEARPFGPDDAVPRDVVGLVRAAYPPGHPDVELGSDHDIVHDIERAQSGGRMGPLMDASTLVFDGERLVALALINRVPGSPPLGGPWVTDICRDPAPGYAGLGRALLKRTLRTCSQAGEEAISLAVTEGNRARSLYESLGFVPVTVTRKVRIPD